MTIRAKLYAAIVMTILGPVITIAVAFAAFQSLSDHFDEVSARSDRLALALEIKYAVTDVNGWQTAYGYDERREPAAVRALGAERQAAARRRRSTAHRTARARDPRAPAHARSTRSWRWTSVAYRALLAGQERRVKRIFLGPEIRNFEAMAAAASQLAAEEQRRNDEVGAGLRSAPDRRQEEPRGRRPRRRAC